MWDLFAEPLVLLGAGLLAALVLRRYAPRSAAIGFGLLALAAYGLSTPALSAQLLRALEPEAGPGAAGGGQPAQAVVVLGGTLRHSAPEYGGDTVGALTLERLRYGAKLYRETGLPILVTGGVIGDSSKTVGLAMAQALESDFRTPVRWIEMEARNTYENAERSAALLGPEGITAIQLVTHAWHMPRAAEAFEHVGFAVVPAPTGFTAAGPGWRVSDFLPTARGLRNSALALHEFVGRIWYHLKYY